MFAHSGSKKWAPLFWVVLIGGLFSALGGLRSDHVWIAIFVLVLSYTGPKPKKLLWFLLPLILTGVVYDSQRFYSDLIRGPIRVKEPYLFDKFFFGIKTDSGVLTPNEWFQLHTHPALDFISGFYYLTFIAMFISLALYWQYWVSRRGTKKVTPEQMGPYSARVIWTFFWVNVLGYSTYYWYPAAPPWYVALKGLGPADLTTPASAAGCLRFDALLGTHFFTGMYGRAADVFGAIPSLHVAYPLLAVWYAFQFGSMRVFAVSFYLIMCFSAVYLNHHYILDILWGSGYALIIASGMHFWVKSKQKQRLR